jgi:tRNA-splicing ligase RtcB
VVVAAKSKTIRLEGVACYVGRAASRQLVRMVVHSAPHGAGRRYSRTKARALVGMDDLSRAMAGIEYRHSKVLLDEIPGAYKDIDEVMDEARDLVEVKYILKQFVNVKGD